MVLTGMASYRERGSEGGREGEREGGSVMIARMTINVTMFS
jgi:hypothetical protein